MMAPLDVGAADVEPASVGVAVGEAASVDGLPCDAERVAAEQNLIAAGSTSAAIPHMLE